MSRPSTLDEPPQPPDADPFRYGWRYVTHTLPDGTTEVEQVPLTLEDVLHPEEGDFRVHTIGHHDDCMYLTYVLQERFHDRGVVLSDCRVDWQRGGVRPHGPDVAVFLDVLPGPDWATFRVGDEGAVPLLVIEVTSPETRSTDVVRKVDHYHRVGVPFYGIVDSVEVDGERAVRLFGYRWRPDDYERVEPDDRGWLWLETVDLWLKDRGSRVALCEPDGTEIADYAMTMDRLHREHHARVEAERQVVAEQERAEAEKQRADVEKQRAEAEKQRADVEKQRADAEAERAKAEKQRADEADRQLAAERQAREALEQQLRDMRSSLDRRNNGSAQ